LAWVSAELHVLSIQELNTSRIEEMKTHLSWFYGRLAKASVPKASSPKWSPFLPKVVLAPDLPVPKRSKVQLRDVTINNGVHWHGLVLVNPVAPKLHGPLDVHINENLRKYLVGSIRTIGVRMVHHRDCYCWEDGHLPLLRDPGNIGAASSGAPPVLRRFSNQP
jgi:hypothetical protein